MITIDLKTITLEGIEYEVEFQEAKVAVLLMSAVYDWRIDICMLMQTAIIKHRYINDFGDEDYQDSDISQFLNDELEDWLRRNWRQHVEWKENHLPAQNGIMSPYDYSKM